MEINCSLNYLIYLFVFSIWIEWITDLLLKAFRNNLFANDESLTLAAASVC